MPARMQFVSWEQAKNAGSTVQYCAQLVDANEAPVPLGAIRALTLGLVDAKTGAVVNGVDNVDILNAGRGKLDAFGKLVVTLGPGDTALLDASHEIEYRSMVLRCDYDTGHLVHPVDFAVRR